MEKPDNAISAPTLPRLIVLCMTLVLPQTGLAALAESAPPDPRQQYLDLIQSEQDLNGPGSRALVEPMTSLALLYLEQGDYDRAAETLARTRGILRAADGFDTLPETALIAQQIHVEEARGNFEAAWEFEKSLLAVAEQHIGAPETFVIFRDVARKRRDLLERYKAGEIPPQIKLGCYYDYAALVNKLFTNSFAESTGFCGSGSRNVVLSSLLVEIRGYQLQAIETLLRNGGYASDDMRQLLTGILRTSDELGRPLPHIARIDGDPVLERLLVNLVSYRPRNTAETVRRAHVLILLADMNVMRAQRGRHYSKYEEALTQYRVAYQTLRNAGVGQATLDAIFAPAVPIVLPAYYGPPQGSNDADASDYVDVSFDISNHGQSDAIEITGMSENVRRGDRRQLVRLINASLFRPVFVDGQAVESAPVTARYHVTEDSTPSLRQRCARRELTGYCLEQE